MQNFQPVHAGHHRIQDDGIGPAGLDLIYGFLAIVRDDDLEAMLGEDMRDDPLENGIVFGKQDAARFTPRGAKRNFFHRLRVANPSARAYRTKGVTPRPGLYTQGGGGYRLQRTNRTVAPSRL